MKKNNDFTMAIFNAFLDLLINISSIYLAILLLNFDIFSKTIVAVSSICAVASIIVYFVSDIYSLRIFDKLHKEIIRLAGAQFFIVCVLIVVTSVAARAKVEYFALIFWSALISFVVLSAKKILSIKLSHAYRARTKRKKTVLLVGSSNSARVYTEQIKENPHYGYAVLGYLGEQEHKGIERLGSYDELESVIEKYNPDEVVIALRISEEDKIQSFIQICDREGIRASIIPPIYKYFKSKCQVDMVGSLPVINTRDINSVSSSSDGQEIRQCAVENNISVFTALDTVKVLLDVLEETTLGISTIDA